MEIAVQGNKDIVRVTVDGNSEEYSLTARPKEQSLAVRAEKRDILHELDLPSIVINLKNSANLLDIAYNAVNGTPMQSKVFGLQKKLLDLSDQSIITVQGFGYKSEAVMGELISVFSWLTSCAEDMAIDRIKACAELARNMRAQAEAMQKNFQKMADETSGVLQETMQQQAGNYAKQEETRKLIDEYQAEQDKLSREQSSLKLRLAEMKSRYTELNSKLEAAEKREETLAIVSMVCSSLSAAVGTAATAFSGRSSQGGQVSGQPQSGQAQQEVAKKEGELAGIQKELDTLQARIEQKETAITGLEEQKRKLSAEADKAEVAELDKQLAAARSERDALVSKKDEQTSKKTQTQAAITALQAAVAGLGAAAGQGQAAAQSAQGAAESYRAQVQECFNCLKELEEKNTQNLGNLAKFTTMIKNTVITKDSIDMAIQSLMVAITCLKNVVVIMQDVALFWAAMEACCDSLGDSRLTDMLTKLQGYSEEKRLQMYRSSPIVGPLFTSIVRWAALASVCADYVRAVKDTRDILTQAIRSPEMSEKDHWKAASRLAAAVGLSIEQQLAAISDKKARIAEQEQQSMLALQ